MRPSSVPSSKAPTVCIIVEYSFVQIYKKFENFGLLITTPTHRWNGFYLRIHISKCKVDPRGIEPPTLSLQMTRSTSELRAQILGSESTSSTKAQVQIFNC